MDAGVSAPVGIRWFRGSGGMPPTHVSPSAKPIIGRYLTLPEREEIAIEVAKGTGINAIARKLGRLARRPKSPIQKFILHSSSLRFGG